MVRFLARLLPWLTLGIGSWVGLGEPNAPAFRPYYAPFVQSGDAANRDPRTTRDPDSPDRTSQD